MDDVLGCSVLVLVIIVVVAILAGISWGLTSWTGITISSGGWGTPGILTFVQWVNNINNLPNIKVNIKEQLGFFDALLNSLLVALVWIVLYVGSLLMSIIAMLYGIITADWDMVAIGCVYFIGSAIVMYLFPIGMWLLLLLQNGTPAYFLVWVLITFPLLLTEEATPIVVITVYD